MIIVISVQIGIIIYLIIKNYSLSKQNRDLHIDNERLKDKVMDKIWFEDFERGGKYAGDV